MTICTCGGRFKTIKIGEAVITKKGLHSCDVKECPDCSKRILDAADMPLAMAFDTEAIERITTAMTAKGCTVYGRE